MNCDKDVIWLGRQEPDMRVGLTGRTARERTRSNPLGPREHAEALRGLRREQKAVSVADEVAQLRRQVSTLAEFGKRALRINLAR